MEEFSINKILRTCGPGLGVKPRTPFGIELAWIVLRDSWTMTFVLRCMSTSASRALAAMKSAGLEFMQLNPFISSAIPAGKTSPRISAISKHETCGICSCN